MILSWFSSLKDTDLDNVLKLLEDAKRNNARLIPITSTINLDGTRVIVTWSGSPSTSDEDLLAELEFHLDDGGYNAEGDEPTYDLYEMKDRRWVVVDTFQSLAEAIEYFGPGRTLQVSGGVYTVNIGEGEPSMLRMLIQSSVA